MSWIKNCAFLDPMTDLRDKPERAQVLGAELAREVTEGHVLHGREWTVVAEATSQDEVLVESADDVFLVHLTWKGSVDAPPWPMTKQIGSATEFEELLNIRY